jgi:hypothetical protein
MSKLLAQLLRVNERDFNKFITRLERACLNPSVDIRLSAEIITKTREKARVLGLDSQDTTPKELYHGLLNKLKTDDLKLKVLLKLDKKNSADSAKVLAKIATKLSKKEKTLCMTSIGAKRVLIAVPPRKTLKALKLRSIESILKREDPRLVYAIAVILEDDSWRSQAHAWMKRLPSKDIQWKSVDVLPMSRIWYEKVSAKILSHGFQLNCPEVGVVIVLPVIESFTAGVTVLALSFILQSAQRLAVNSMPYRRQGFMQGYHNALPEIAHGRQGTLTSIHGLVPSWRAVHEMISRGFLEESLPEVDLIITDLNWQSIEMKLTILNPEMDFWIDTHYLGLKSDTNPVSLHLLDVAIALASKIEFEKQGISHMEGSLWNELQIRYLQQDVLSKSLLRQLRSEANSDDMLL